MMQLALAISFQKTRGRSSMPRSRKKDSIERFFAQEQALLWQQDTPCTLKASSMYQRGKEDDTPHFRSQVAVAADGSAGPVVAILS
jgi:hypothetical protein